MSEDYLPQFRHLPPLSAGHLLQDPYSKDPPPWVCKYTVCYVLSILSSIHPANTTSSTAYAGPVPRHDAALHYLFHSPEHFSALPLSVAASPLGPTLPTMPVVAPASPASPPSTPTPAASFGIKPPYRPENQHRLRPRSQPNGEGDGTGKGTVTG